MSKVGLALHPTKIQAPLQQSIKRHSEASSGHDDVFTSHASLFNGTTCHCRVSLWIYWHGSLMVLTHSRPEARKLPCSDAASARGIVHSLAGFWQACQVAQCPECSTGAEPANCLSSMSKRTPDLSGSSALQVTSLRALPTLAICDHCHLRHCWHRRQLSRCSFISQARLEYCTVAFRV